MNRRLIFIMFINLILVLASQGCGPGFVPRLTQPSDFISLSSDDDSNKHVAYAPGFVQGYRGETLELFVVMQAKVDVADYTFKWFRDGVNIQTSVGNPRYVILDSTPADTGDYEVQVFKKGPKDVFTAPIFVQVLENPSEPKAPQIVLEPKSTVAPLGETVVLRAVVLSSPTATATWYKNGQVLNGQSKPHLILRGLTATDYADYWVRFENQHGSAVSEIATVSAAASTAGAKIHVASHVNGAHIVLTEGETLDLWVRARGAGNIFHWFFNDELLDQELHRHLRRPFVRAEDAGDYRVNVSNAYGVDSYVFHVTVNCREGRVGPHCVPETRSCQIANGTGLQTWDDGDYGTCQILSCDSGFFNNGIRCQPNTPESSSYAILTGFPQGVSSSPRLTVGVSSADPSIVSYRYKIGLAALTNCADGAGYSPALALQQPIDEDVHRFADGPLRLCVVVGNYLGYWQPFGAASVADWVKKERLPIARILNAPTRPLRDPLLNLFIGSDDPSAISYRAKLGSAGVLNCADANGYGAELPLSVPFLADASAILDQNVRVCVVAKDSYGLWQPFSIATVAEWHRPNCAVNRLITVNEPRIQGWYVHAGQGANYCRVMYGYGLWSQNTKTRHHEDFAIFNGQGWYRQHYSQEPALTSVTCGPKPGCE